MNRPTLLASALWLALAATAHAETAADTGADINELERIQVTATRSERAIADVPNTVDVIERERMDELMVRDLKDLFRYEPGITVGSSFGRFGLGDIRIRGLGGNRVRIQTDGIPVSDAFSIGSFSNANRNFVDLDTLKRVEVVRGPTSSLYGSDALGGVVSFITKDPSDYLKEGKDAYFGFKLGYDSSWEGLFGGATAAFGSERWSGLVAVSHRQGKETENQGEVGGTGSTRTQPNPQDRDGRSVLSKLVYAPSADQRFRLTVEGNEDSTDTDLLTSRGFQALTGATNNLVLGRDHQTRARVSFAHELDAVNAGFADSLDWQVYRQDSETTQYTLEERSLPPPTLRDRREREFNFDQRLYGLQVNFRKGFATGDVKHDLAYGLDLSRSETRQKRDGLRTFLNTGATTPSMLPDVFPVRDFPISKTTTAALYLQDEINFAEGAFRLIPALRVDHYKLKPEVDNIFAEDNPGVVVSEVSETNVSPKLGAVWQFADKWSLFGGYARGFRSPPYNDVNIGFTNLLFGYTAIANPDLKPETSDGLEAGLRFAGDAVYASMSGYYNRYDDFIESLRFIGFNDEGLMVYQSQNIAEAKIYGVELKAGLDIGALSEKWEGWSLRGAAAWSRGEDETADVPLDSVDPLTATLGIAYEREAWGAELAGRFVDRKDRVSDPGLYQQAGYGVVDLYAHWSLAPGTTVNVGVFNLADRKYSEAGDVPLVNGGSAVLDRYTSPGRNFSVSLSVNW
ncbi:TonB-dependent hemoglobin/transferrin/lactoferrin family receptor [Pseudoxanthomonas sacheonensis]|uniref:Hemoglobin/transferrin/lactoferrin receptor protein n=1 Tax=Pseudoxanthomonas sacheonensis TaxID=443615 RepID=A0ABU1RMM8_9GAMM|nr:TonB-dependent hemoglobin/transferrin/lactoferrin family receptor [Pseudoxanthomonas sacheonensis]MDR6839862.1 hemoglobin/transferrin/lactoferrin receptor protein [Pseudoxanthomonas sacheonensis]